jgi:Xaa-Pro aminopeptidase
MKEQLQLHREKIDQARAYMRERGIDLAVTRDRGTGDPSVPLLFGVKTGADAIYLLTDERLVAIVASDDEVTVRDADLFDEVLVYADGADGPGELLGARVRSLDPGRIALNYSRSNHLADGLTVGSYRSLLRMLGEPYSGRIVSSEDYIQKLRSIKSAQEIAYIRRAIEITLEIYDEVFAAVRPGMSEIEVGRLFTEGMRARGVVNGISRDLAPPIVMKHKIAHRPPGEGVLEPGDYVIIDFSVDYMGYCSDIARSAYVLRDGETEASEAMTKAFRTVREATDLAVAALKPGAIGKDVDHAARQYVLDKGYPNIFHSVGHQVGRDVHDGGTILGPERQGYRKDALGTVEEGMVFAVEPTILYEEGPAIISEDNYVVTANGAELLGEPQRELVLIRSGSAEP